MSEGMPIPDWAKDPELKKQMRDAIADEKVAGTFKTENLEPITNYSTFFAEWSAKQDVEGSPTMLVHLFPRDGVEDKWEEGHYTQRCRSCRGEVPLELAQKRKPCPRCGHIGLIYVPGRREEKGKASFPRDMLNRVKAACDEVWEGYVAIEPLMELGAVVVQFQDVSMSDEALYAMLERFCDAVDGQLEKGA